MLALALLASLSTASAQPTEATEEEVPACRPRGAFLVVDLPGTWEDGERGAVVAELRAALRVQGFDLCLAETRWPPAVRPVAILTLEALRGAVVRVDVQDAVTDKRVRRELALRGMPRDSRPLAVAIGADELLRASWAELLLPDAPPPAEEPPQEVRRVIERTAAAVVEQRAPRAPWWLSAAFGFERYGGGERLLGGGLQLEGWMHARIGTRLSLGGRAGLPTEGIGGSVESRGLLAEIALLGAVLGDARRGPQLVLSGALAVAWVRFRGDAAEGFVARTDAGVAVLARGGLGGRWAFGPVRLALDVGLGAPITGVAAQENGVTLSAISALELHGAFSFGVRL
ncbi:MAG: hypothetical protein KF901_04050 [Myxococcales bacterium]|nr:hypothetical protein [Myxococcales bacterium]